MKMPLKPEIFITIVCIENLQVGVKIKTTTNIIQHDFSTAILPVSIKLKENFFDELPEYRDLQSSNFLGLIRIKAHSY